MPLQKLKRVARIVDAAMRDGARARSHSADPAFRDGVQKDRRAELSKFKTVQHALADRERLVKSKTAKSKAKARKK